MINGFTISFRFGGKTYLAFATIKEENNGESFYVVNIYDNALCRIINGDRIKYSQKEAEENPKFQNPNADRLFHCISDSVSAHLQSARLINDSGNGYPSA